MARGGARRPPQGCDARYPGHRELPPAMAPIGQPVLIGGTMGRHRHPCGTSEGMALAFGSCAMARAVHDRSEATLPRAASSTSSRTWRARQRDARGVAEGRRLDVDAVVDAAARAASAQGRAPRAGHLYQGEAYGAASSVHGRIDLPGPRREWLSAGLR
jgi:hypothetical protein